MIKTCDAVWMQGGDQAKHAKCLLRGDGSDTKILEAMRYVHDRGGVIAGTSAGMHIMSDPVFGYGNIEDSLIANETEAFTIEEIPNINSIDTEIENNNLMHPGIGFMPAGVVNDTHFDERGRLGRLIVAMRDTEAEIGIGADEGTGFAITEIDGDMVGEVVGNHGIFIVDSYYADYEGSGQDVAFGVDELLVHYLSKGDTYNFDSYEVIPASNKILVDEVADFDFAKTPAPFGKNMAQRKQ